MRDPQNYLPETASQTAGPYVHIGLVPSDTGIKIYDHELGRDIAGPNAKGERIRVQGRLIDGNGAALKDGLIEVWQANAAGVYADPESSGDVEEGFRGWGRVIADFDSGAWFFETVKPGAGPGRSGARQAPHISLWIVARGINIGLNTRLYFGDEGAANDADPVLGRVDPPHRRDTLIATRDDSGDTPVYRFDIRLQGDRETVFFDI
jgi:protocatechuate 3,4-dioxygenase, alpha subunit